MTNTPDPDHEAVTDLDVFPPTDAAELGDTPLAHAVNAYLGRRAGTEHPRARRDAADRWWYPAADEWQACCDVIRPPSRYWPWSLMLHCYSVAHVAHLYGVNATDLYRATLPHTPAEATRPPRPLRSTPELDVLDVDPDTGELLTPSPPWSDADRRRQAEAARAYLARRSGTEHPRARRDAADRWWYPAADEWRACCDVICPPSRYWPWSLLLHCYSVAHVAYLYGVDAGSLRLAVHDRTYPARYVLRPDDDAPIDPSGLPEQPAPDRKEPT